MLLSGAALMGLEMAGLFDAAQDLELEILGRAIFAALDEKADRLLEGRAGAGQLLGQVEHAPVLLVRDDEPQIAIEDRERLTDQVEPGLRQPLACVLALHPVLPRPRANTPPPAEKARNRRDKDS